MQRETNYRQTSRMRKARAIPVRSEPNGARRCNYAQACHGPPTSTRDCRLCCSTYVLALLLFHILLTLLRPCASPWLAPCFPPGSTSSLLPPRLLPPTPSASSSSAPPSPEGVGIQEPSRRNFITTKSQNFRTRKEPVEPHTAILQKRTAQTPEPKSEFEAADFNSPRPHRPPDFLTPDSPSAYLASTCPHSCIACHRVVGSCFCSTGPPCHERATTKLRASNCAPVAEAVSVTARNLSQTKLHDT